MTAMYGLTRAQRRALTFIGEYENKSAVSPSYEEIKFALGLKSKSEVHRIVLALEARGFIRRIPNNARSIRIVKDADIYTDEDHLRKLLRPDQFDALVADAKREQMSTAGRLRELVNAGLGLQ